MINERCLTVKQVSELLQVSERTFYTLMDKFPDLPKFKVGENNRFNFDDVITFLKDKSEGKRINLQTMKLEGGEV